VNYTFVPSSMPLDAYRGGGRGPQARGKKRFTGEHRRAMGRDAGVQASKGGRKRNVLVCIGLQLHCGSPG